MGAAALGVLGSVLLVVGSYAYNRLPAETWNARSSLLIWWRGLSDARALGMTVSALGLVLLTVAWVALVRRVRGRPDGVRTVVVTAVLWALPLFLAGPVFSGDGWSYVATGYLTGHGHDPYHVAVAMLPGPLQSGVSPAWLTTPTPYGPLPLLWGALFSRITSDPWLLLAAYRLLALLALLALAWAVARLARRQGIDPAVAVALACASPFAIGHGIGGLHNDLLMAALGAAALAVAGERHWSLAAALVGAAAAVKIPGALFAVGVVLMSLPAAASLGTRLLRAAQVAVVAGVVLLLSGVPGGLGIGWLSALSVPDSGRVHLSIVAMLAALVGTTVPANVATGIALAIGGVILLRWRTGPGPAVLIGGALAMLAMTVFSPVVHYWYFLWSVPVLCALRLPRVWAAAVVAEAAALGLTAVCDPAQRIGWVSAAGVIGVFGAPLAAYYVTSYVTKARLRTVVTDE
ncbi:MAG TPA: polyprenol phosphomannose-dependent alpha 1,6 mannosyltransferase MptB [Nocardioides sp.]|nr:polyprenol phosphomannose-dependent alpha 1,6 mannosyltransferase MptB [Nocardioides sp.]